MASSYSLLPFVPPAYFTENIYIYINMYVYVYILCYMYMRFHILDILIFFKLQKMYFYSKLQVTVAWVGMVLEVMIY